MTYQIPTCPPADITAGDSIEFDWSLPDYPASQGWELTLAFRTEGGAGATGDLDADFDQVVGPISANGDVFEVRISADSTEDLIAGPYRLTARVENAAEGVTKSWLVNKPLVHADPATDVGAKSHARTMRDALRTALQSGAANGAYASIQVNGRTIQYKTQDDYNQALAHWDLQVALEENPNAELSHAARFVRG